MASIRVGTRLARALVVLIGVILVAGTDQCQAEQAVQAQSAPPADVAAEAARLISAYPDLLDSIEGNTLVWKDGTRMEFDDGKFEVIIVTNPAEWGKTTIVAHKRNPVTQDDLAVLGLAPRTIPRGRTIDVRIFRPDGMGPLPAQIDGEELGTGTGRTKTKGLQHA